MANKPTDEIKSNHKNIHRKEARKGRKGRQNTDRRNREK